MTVGVNVPPPTDSTIPEGGVLSASGKSVATTEVEAAHARTGVNTSVMTTLSKPAVSS
jgi:hypothetical protein